MSLISKALKKIQDSRLIDQDENLTIQAQNIKEIVFLSDAPRSWLKTTMMAILAIGTITAIILSVDAINLALRNSESKQIQVLGLEKTVKAQEKRINDLITTLNKNQKFKDGQIRDLNIRLNNLSSTNSTHYDSVKEAIIDEKQQINSLNETLRTLEQKIEALSATANAQAPNVIIPASGA